MPRMSESGTWVGSCIKCDTELPERRLSVTQAGWYLCPTCVESDHGYTIVEYADEVK